MSIELSSDLRQALDAEGTPLRIVDPHTGSVDVLVSEMVLEQVHPSHLPGAQRVTTNGRKWSEEKNRRRCELIDKEIEGTITAEDSIELEALQREMLAYRRRVAPLPLDDLRNLHQTVLEQAARNCQ
jgi:hypothetical protein